MSEETKALATVNTSKGITISSFQDLRSFADMVVRSNLAPAHIKSPEDACIVLQYGLEIGLTPMQSLQGLHVVKGKLGADGDTLLALIRRSTVCKWIKLKIEGKGESLKCTVTSEREHHGEISTEFTWQQAKEAGLIASDTYRKYGFRMIQWRAVGYHAKDYYSDVVKGLDSIEEIESVEESREQMKMPASKATIVSEERKATNIIFVKAHTTPNLTWEIHDVDEVIYGSYLPEVAARAEAALSTGEEVILHFKTGGKRPIITRVVMHEPDVSDPAPEPAVLKKKTTPAEAIDAEFTDDDFPEFLNGDAPL